MAHAPPSKGLRAQPAKAEPAAILATPGINTGYRRWRCTSTLRARDGEFGKLPHRIVTGRGSIDFIPNGDTAGGRVGRCPCGVEFRVATDDQLDHLVAAIREHAKGSHDYEVTREHVLAELGVQEA